MPSDATTTTAVIAALAGGAGGFLGAALSAFLGERGRREEHRREQQRADASVVGPVMAFLADTNPDILGLNVRSDVAAQQKVMAPLAARSDNIYGELLVLAAGHPSARVSELARELAVAVRKTFRSTSLFLIDLIERNGAANARDRANADYEETRKLADGLLQEIARYGRQRPRRR